ncbi:MAG: protein kinase [Deltaproteobacteria bacterium]|nr:protein kinase [Deltaproteobacteria bacterium]
MPSDSQSFGRYRLLGKLGSGGMAEVWRAEQVSGAGITRTVVIKKILRTHAADARFKEMFLEEARIAAGLNHGNIVQVLDVDEVDGEPYLALEFVHGRSLADLLDRLAEQGRRMPEAYACLIALEMCKGLHHAHTRTDASHKPMRIVHRDISPQNVMLSFEGEVKLVDFGIARAYGDERPGRTKTATGVIKGKYVYFSPEQARSRELDGRTDVYATGVCLYEMLTGRLPFSGPMADVLRKIVLGEYPHPRTICPDISEQSDSIVRRALASQEGRYETALEMQEELAAHVARSAPGLGTPDVANMVRLVFEGELALAGEAVNVSNDFRGAMERWPRMDSSVEAEPLTAPPTAPPPAVTAPDVVATGSTVVEDRSRRPIVLALAGLGAAGVVVAGLSAIFEPPTPGPPPDALATKKLIAPPTPPAPAPAPAPTPAAPTGHGGKVVAGMVCDGQPKAPLEDGSIWAARQALEQGDGNAAMTALVAAIAAEPTAGRLYLGLADAVLLRDAPAPAAAPALESWKLSCQGSTDRAEIVAALDVASQAHANTDLGREPVLFAARTMLTSRAYAGATATLEDQSSIGDADADGLHSYAGREATLRQALIRTWMGQGDADDKAALTGAVPSSVYAPAAQKALREKPDWQLKSSGELLATLENQFRDHELGRVRQTISDNRSRLAQLGELHSLEQRLADENARQSVVSRAETAGLPSPTMITELGAIPKGSAFYSQAQEILRRTAQFTSQSAHYQQLKAERKAGTTGKVVHSPEAVSLLKSGNAKLRAGDNQGALVLLKRVVEIDPNFPDGLRALAGCLARMNHNEEAAVYYRKFLMVAPNDPSAPTIRKAVEDYEAGHK